MNNFSPQEIQVEFAAALTAREHDARPGGLEREATERFRVYRNNFYHGLGQQLAAAYPVVRRLVGDEFFFATAREYLAVHPPRSRSLALFGGEFPGFLEGFPPAESLPYLPDVARLERAWLEALHAADVAPLAPAELSRLGPALAESRFVAHPAARIVSSDYPMVDLWRSNQPDEDPGRYKFNVVGQSALITRRYLEVQVRELSASQAAFGRSLFSGENIATAMERVGRSADEFDVTAALRDLLVAGAFERIRPLPEPSKQHNDGS